MKKYSKANKVLRSLKFRVFTVVALTVIVPTLISSIFIYHIAVNNYCNKRINRFKAGNTVIQNTADTAHYFDENENEEIAGDVQQTDNTILQNNSQIEHLSKAYGCRIQIINAKSVILYDSGSDSGKTSLAQIVQESLSGKSLEKEADGYMEYANPVMVNSENSSGKTVLGVIYTSYSLKEVQEYREVVGRYVSMTVILMIILALLAAWLLSILFTKPIKRIEKSITELSLGKELQDAETKKDYVELMEISRDFKELVERWTTQVQSQQEFVSNVSHELKTPITSMKILADSLLGQQGMPEELYQEFLQDISKEIDRENDIITDLLELVRMEKSQTEITISTANINDIVEMVLKRLKPIAEAKNIELVFESFRPVAADVDEVKFSSVVNNLVENAIKYNNEDGTVTVSLNSDHQYFYLKVTDTGIGIAEEDQARVFERFFRVDKARARETGGSGLGLAITREIILKHHGSIKVHSKEGEGTTFIARIPLKYIQQDNL